MLRTVIARWHEVKVFIAVEGLHSGVSLVQAVLSRDFVATRKMINLLKPAEVAIDVRFDYRGTPDKHNGIAAQEVAV